MGVRRKRAWELRRGVLADRSPPVQHSPCVSLHSRVVCSFLVAALCACGAKDPYVPEEPDPLSSLVGGSGGVAGSAGALTDAESPEDTGLAGSGGAAGEGGSVGQGGAGGVNEKCSDPATNEPATLTINNNWLEHNLRVNQLTPSCGQGEPQWIVYPSSLTLQAELYDVFQVRDDSTSALVKTLRLEQVETTVTIP